MRRLLRCRRPAHPPRARMQRSQPQLRRPRPLLKALVSSSCFSSCTGSAGAAQRERSAEAFRSQCKAGAEVMADVQGAKLSPKCLIEESLLLQGHLHPLLSGHLRRPAPVRLAEPQPGPPAGLLPGRPLLRPCGAGWRSGCLASWRLLRLRQGLYQLLSLMPRELRCCFMPSL